MAPNTEPTRTVEWQGRQVPVWPMRTIDYGLLLSQDPAEVDAGTALVLEGVGAGSSPWADLISALVWLEADPDERMRRGIERDGAAFAPHWEAWARAEAAHFAAHRTRERADLVLHT